MTLVSTASFSALGTTARVVVTDPGQLGAARAIVEAEIAACDQTCSRFLPDSELSQLNGRAGRPVSISSRLLDEITTALRAARLTDGAVDPTVGQALIRLGYDRDFPLVGAAQSPREVVFLPVPGWRCVHVDRRRRRVQVPPGVVVDLGATAKARCADRAATSATTGTGCGVLVSLGGDVAVAGAAPSGGWLVRVADSAAAGPDAPGQTVEVAVGGLATSGVSVRAWRRCATDVHHLINPRTGAPAPVVWRTVTVAAASCTDANIASTAAIVLGHQAPDWLEARRLPARLVAPDGTVCRVAGWPPEAADALAEAVPC
jgi:thiamine biosynthesis lipoprotein